VKLFKSLGDRILKLFLSDVSAGACVPEHGCCCGTYRRRRIDCYGSCGVVSDCRTGSGCNYY